MGFKEKNEMKIDRHNYEEFFILYWDNELTASQKQAVEDFVKENSDLQEELQILGATRFTPENNIRFEEKEFLLDSSSINITNYEEQLLNYIDDELASDERNEVERATAKYPVIQKELSLLQRAKLQPEQAIIFPEKLVLYRREEKVRVISMTWFRVAVAAAIILIAGFITFRLVNTGNSGDKNEVVKNTDSNKPISPITSPTVQPINQPQKEESGSLATQEEKAAPIKSTIEKKNQKPVIEDNLADNIVTDSGNKNKIPKERSGKTFTEPNKTIEGAVADLPIERKDYSSPEKNKSETINTVFSDPDVTLQSGYALDTKPPGPMEKEKGSLKEFLRKTTRVFERRTKIQTTTEDNKLLVGAFAVSLK